MAGDSSLTFKRTRVPLLVEEPFSEPRLEQDVVQHEQEFVQHEQEFVQSVRVVQKRQDWTSVKKGLKEDWQDYSEKTKKTYNSIVSMMQDEIPELDATKFASQARLFCMNRTSQCKVNQAKTVSKAIALHLKVDKGAMDKALKTIRFVKSNQTVKREPYENDQLDLYASRVKWHPYLSSVMMFLLTCSGRAQDAFNVESKLLLESLKTGNPFEISRVEKKTGWVHLYLPDTESTPHILPFVQARVDAGAKYVWGSLRQQGAIDQRLREVYKKLFKPDEFKLLKPTRSHTFRHTRIT